MVPMPLDLDLQEVGSNEHQDYFVFSKSFLFIILSQWNNWNYLNPNLYFLQLLFQTAELNVVRYSKDNGRFCCVHY